MAKSKSKTAEGNASRYKSEKRQESNRKRKLEKQLKLQPTNEQVKLALKDIHYRRKTPTKQEWSASWIATAKLFKEFSGRFDRNIMSANPKVSQEALMVKGPVASTYEPRKLTKAESNFFSLENRVMGR